MGKTLPPRKAMLRPEDPIGNTSHGRELPEDLKVRVPPSKSQKLRNKYAHRKAGKLHNKIEEALLQRDNSKAILSNLEAGLKDIETKNWSMRIHNILSILFIMWMNNNPQRVKTRTHQYHQAGRTLFHNGRV